MTAKAAPAREGMASRSHCVPVSRTERETDGVIVRQNGLRCP